MPGIVFEGVNDNTYTSEKLQLVAVPGNSFVTFTDYPRMNSKKGILIVLQMKASQESCLIRHSVVWVAIWPRSRSLL